jgi:hypothetical protein
LAAALWVTRAALQHQHARTQIVELPTDAVHHRQREPGRQDLVLDGRVIHQGEVGVDFAGHPIQAVHLFRQGQAPSKTRGGTKLHGVAQVVAQMLQPGRQA